MSHNSRGSDLSHSPSALQETQRMDVEEEELAGSYNDCVETLELSIDRAGIVLLRSLSDIIDDGKDHICRSFTHHCMCLVTWIQMM